MSILRSIFGPSKDELWMQLCDQVGGEFAPGGFWKGTSKVQVQHEQWSITLDTYTHLLPSMQNEAAEAIDRIFRDAAA